MRRILFDNIGLKLLSAFISVALWVYVLDHENPILTRRVSLPVKAVSVPEGLAVMDIAPDQVEVLLRGRQSLLDDAHLSVARAVVNMARHDFGEHDVRAELVLPQGVTAVDDFEVSVHVKLDTVVAKERPVAVETSGAPAEGFASTDVTVNPTEITLRGPVAWTQRVARVVAMVDISGQSATVQRLVPVEARDAGNVRIPGLALSPDRVEVTVSIQKVSTRTVPVRASLGPPAQGYAVSEVKVDPTTVTLGGKGQVEAVETEKIDISELRGTRTYSVPLQIPEGATIVGIGSAHVTVTVVGTSGAAPTPSTTGRASESGESAAKGGPNGAQSPADGTSKAAPPGAPGGQPGAPDGPARSRGQSGASPATPQSPGDDGAQRPGAQPGTSP